MAKKSDPNFFNKGVAGSKEMAETGASLALRALGWGSMFAVLGTGSLAFAIWKLSGAKDVSWDWNVQISRLNLMLISSSDERFPR